MGSSIYINPDNFYEHTYTSTHKDIYVHPPSIFHTSFSIESPHGYKAFHPQFLLTIVAFLLHILPEANIHM